MLFCQVFFFLFGYTVLINILALHKAQRFSERDMKVVDFLPFSDKKAEEYLKP